MNLAAAARLRSGALSLVGLAAGAGAWEYVGRHSSRASFAPFSDTVSALWHLLRSGQLLHALASSLELFGAGLGIAIGIGFLVGLLLARVEILRIGLEPYVAALYATPMVALVPFILAVVGFEFKSKLIVVVLFGVWPILINTLEGARSVNVELLEVARSYRSNELQLWGHVVIPYTLPYTMTGVRQSIARCLVGMLVGEFFFAATGLGNLILINTQRFETANVLASIMTISLLGVVLMTIGRALEDYFARWKAGV
jgi:ABC-type nitrate/sulfonate/bicarbonate transport system permease component